MPNNESVGKKIVEALKRQAENIDNVSTSVFETEPEDMQKEEDIFETNANDDIFADPEPVIKHAKSENFFDDIEEDDEPFYAETKTVKPQNQDSSDGFEMPANIAVLRKLIAQLPNGVSRHTGAQIIKQTMEALGISMKSVLQDAQQVQESLKISARECQASIQEYKKQILMLEKQSQSYQKQYSALNDLISLFIQTTK